jgi:hydrogenase large subunit
MKGTAEQALMGTTIQNLENPVELGRIIRSFDPCVSCATHVYSQGECIKTIQVVQ